MFQAVASKPILDMVSVCGGNGMAGSLAPHQRVKGKQPS